MVLWRHYDVIKSTFFGKKLCKNATFPMRVKCMLTLSTWYQKNYLKIFVHKYHTYLVIHIEKNFKSCYDIIMTSSIWCILRFKMQNGGGFVPAPEIRWCFRAGIIFSTKEIEYWASLKFDRISNVPTEGVQKWPHNEKNINFQNIATLYSWQWQSNNPVIKSCCKFQLFRKSIPIATRCDILCPI